MAEPDEHDHADERPPDPSADPPPAPPQDQTPARRGDARSVAQTKPTPTAPRARFLPPWKVLLHDDNVNRIDFVVETVMVITPLREYEAIQRTLEAHHTGVSMLLTTHQERAELYRDQFASRNLTVTIEPSD